MDRAMFAVRSPDAGTPAGTVVVRAAALRFHGGTVTAGDAMPVQGELAVFCHPVVTAPAAVRRDGTMLAVGSRNDSQALFDKLELAL